MTRRNGSKPDKIPDSAIKMAQQFYDYRQKAQVAVLHENLKRLYYSAPRGLPSHEYKKESHDG